MYISPLTPTFYPQAQTLYEHSFPKVERRDSQEWKDFWHNNDKFFIDSIFVDEHLFGGFISYWIFADFVYVEHFAISPSLRGKGIGGDSLDRFVKRFSTLPIVLEVEKPTDNTAARRIAFYEKHNFSLLPSPYNQPPYHHGGEPLPLHIMCTHSTTVLPRFNSIVNKIHKEVYGVYSVKDASIIK